jgi:hypothetical protein
MELEPNWEEMGLDDEMLFKQEAMSFWLQYSPSLFIQAIVNEIRTISIFIQNATRLIAEDSSTASVVLERSGAHRPLLTVCEDITTSIETLKDILDTARRYSEVIQSQESAE